MKSDGFSLMVLPLRRLKTIKNGSIKTSVTRPVQRCDFYPVVFVKKTGLEHVNDEQVRKQEPDVTEKQQ